MSAESRGVRPPRATRAPSPTTRARLSRVARWLGGGLLAVFLIGAARAVDRRALVDALRSADVGLVLLAAALNFVHLAWKTGYWGAMVAPVARVPFFRMLRYTLVSVAMSSVAPARAGDFARVWMLRRHHGVPLRASGAIVAYERLADVTSLLAMLAPLPWLLPSLPTQARLAMRILSALAALVAVAIVVVRRSRRVRAWMQLPDGIERAMLLALVPNALSWLTDLVEIALVARAVGVDASFATSALVLLGVNLAIAIPATPAHVGTLELGAIAALGLRGVPTDRATAFALLYHVMQLVPVVAVGFALSRGVLGRARDEASSDATDANDANGVRDANDAMIADAIEPSAGQA